MHHAVLPYLRALVAIGLTYALLVTAITGPASAPEAADPADPADPATAIDVLVAAALARQGDAVPAVVDDMAFLRRAYLDLVGRIPTSEEADRFLADPSPDRRGALTHRLIGSAGWGHRLTDRLADLLRIQTRLSGLQSGQPYLDAVRDAVAANEPWDRLVRRMLTASGPVYAPGNGLTGFWLRDQGMPLDHLANTVRVVAGTQIGCAMCHDHPFDRWTRADFYHLAAYTAGVRVAVRDLPKPPATADPEQRRAAIAVRAALGTAVFLHHRADGTITLPSDWVQDGHVPGARLRARPLCGTAPAIGADPRQAFADWITGPEQPRFALVIANRMWHMVMGAGFIEPVDELTEQTPIPDPALAGHLAGLMVTVGYDLQAFTRILCRTQAYQRPRVPPPAVGRLAAGPVAGRLAASQLWDSWVTLAGGDRDADTGPDASAIQEFQQAHASATAAGIADIVADMVAARTRITALREQERAIRAEPGATGPGASRRLKSLRDERRRLESAANLPLRAGGPAPAEGLVRRASALPQPAPPSHPLRVFGQSDRTIVDGGHTAATVPQALFLLNGLGDRWLMASESDLARRLNAATDPAALVAAAYRAILSRPPTLAESARWRTRLASGEASPADVVVVLVSSPAFLELP
jgi:hypothetical protein